MTKTDDFFNMDYELEEDSFNMIHLWVDTKNMKIHIVDTGSRSDGKEHEHHTDYVKKHPSLFGLDYEDVAWAKDVRDDSLMEKIKERGFVRSTLNIRRNEIGLEGSKLRDIYKSTRFLMNEFSIEPEVIYIDIGNIMSADSHLAIHERLSGDRLTVFLKSGNITRSKLMVEKEDWGTFTHDGVEYDLGGIIKEVEHSSIKTAKVDDLRWVLKFDKLDFERLENADLNFPILVVRWKGQWATVDGLHRLAKAVLEGKGTIKCRVVSKEVLDRHRVEIDEMVVMEKEIFGLNEKTGFAHNIISHLGELGDEKFKKYFGKIYRDIGKRFNKSGLNYTRDYPEYKGRQYKDTIRIIDGDIKYVLIMEMSIKKPQGSRTDTYTFKDVSLSFGMGSNTFSSNFKFVNKFFTPSLEFNDNTNLYQLIGLPLLSLIKEMAQELNSDKSWDQKLADNVLKSHMSSQSPTYYRKEYLTSLKNLNNHIRQIFDNN